MSKFFSTSVFLVEGAPRPFYHLRDAVGWCADNGRNKSEIVKYDSINEYEYHQHLLELERDGEISDLRRQVEYELTPDICERVVKGSKLKTTWLVGKLVFDKRKDAVAWCKTQKIPSKFVKKWQEVQPVYKDIKLERKSVYTADFVYRDKTGKQHVVDVKSIYTLKEKDYVLRRKLMLWIHKIKIEEIVYGAKK